MVCPPFKKNIQFLSLDVLEAFRVREKVFNMNSSTLSPRNNKKPCDVAPLEVNE